MPYEISTEVSFSAAHYIAGYEGDCARMHGHNWRVRATLRADGGRGGAPRAGEQGPAGLTYDFRKLHALMADVARLVDHTVLNDLSLFKHKNPTAEAIAEWFYGEIAKRIEGEPARIARVEVWESPFNCAAYFKE
jgi:6-pyruvoyltetrahydropterin/6-carboxytetrahydropterin synthase